MNETELQDAFKTFDEINKIDMTRPWYQDIIDILEGMHYKYELHIKEPRRSGILSKPDVHDVSSWVASYCNLVMDNSDLVEIIAKDFIYEHYLQIDDTEGPREFYAMLECQKRGIHKLHYLPDPEILTPAKLRPERYPILLEGINLCIRVIGPADEEFQKLKDPIMKTLNYFKTKKAMMLKETEKDAIKYHPAIEECFNVTLNCFHEWILTIQSTLGQYKEKKPANDPDIPTYAPEELPWQKEKEKKQKDANEKLLLHMAMGSLEQNY